MLPGRRAADDRPAPPPPTLSPPSLSALDVLWIPLLLSQLLLGVRVLARLVRTTGGERIAAVDQARPGDGAVSAIVPVLNERARLAPCLEGLIAQGPELREIVVVDGGSHDGTQDLVAVYRERDSRLRLIDARPIPRE